MHFYNNMKVRITEQDLHRMVINAVNQILRESAMDDYEQAKAELRAARESGNKKAILAASQKFQAAKEAAGQANIIKNPDAYWSDRENEKRGIEPTVGSGAWRVKGNMKNKQELDKMDRERLQINPDLDIQI